MKLSSNKIRLLREAIGAYNYPPVTYDFATERESIHLGMASVESLIQEQLLSADSNIVRDGLSNVLYWGYATQEGRQSDRVARFRAKVTRATLNNCIALFCNLDSLDPKSIGHRHIRELPQFGFAFSTKLFMFLNPLKYVVLDAQLGKLRGLRGNQIFGRLSPRQKDGYLPLSRANIAAYAEWCQFCEHIAETYDDLKARAVDVERGIYHMVTRGCLDDAADITASA